MLKELNLTNVGPASLMELEFGERLNLVTGDNGLGKSFLLDIAWWSMTRKWPAELNNSLTVGKKVRPLPKKDGEISFTFTGKSKDERYTSNYQPREEAWTGRAGRPANPGLVLYAMSDGSFAVWDPARNYWQTKNNVDVQERRPAFVFSPADVWDGLENEGSVLCNGLVQDWATWQKEDGEAFKLLKKVLKVLSPNDKEAMVPGKLGKLSLDDVRDIPTLTMPYRQDVLVLHASSGMKRVMALAYFLVWAWLEHRKAADHLGEDPTHQVVFLIDEVESHLHPSWQRTIVPALLGVMKELTRRPDVQLITATHSPLIMASVEPLFDERKDAWFDLDLEQGEVVLRKRPFVRQGDASRWLTSEAFDLSSAGSREAEAVLSKAAKAMAEPDFDAQEAIKVDAELRKVLSDTDPFWMRWRFVAEKKGWL
tara:strand:- start:8339 stop:9613 length:1275 start_codon:yes stop_codon:yes gene_type:complete